MRLPVDQPAGPRAEIEVLDSRVLLSGRQNLWIRHGEMLYRLQHTRSGKLILTK